MDKGLFNRLQGELNARDKSAGLSMADVLALPEPLCTLVSWMIRKGQATLPEIKDYLKQDEAPVRKLLANLIEKGFVREIEVRGQSQYRVRLAPKKGQNLSRNLWGNLDDETSKK